MKTSFSANLRAALALSCITTAWLWKVTRTDATLLGFTSHQDDINGDELGGAAAGVVYSASTGFTPSQISANSNLSVPNMNVQGFLQSPTITEADLLAGKWDFATVELMLCNYEDLSMGAGILAKGTLGKVTAGRVAFEAEIRGLIQQLQQEIGRIISPDCDAVLYDSRCTVDPAGFEVAGTITDLVFDGPFISRSAFIDSSRAEANGYFDYGTITVTDLYFSNPPATMEVKRSYANGRIELEYEMPFGPLPPDSYTMRPGCDRKPGTCSDKFSNRANFRGFEYVPGIDWQMSGKQ